MIFEKIKIQDSSEVTGINIKKFMCLDGKERDIRVRKNNDGTFHYSYTVYKNDKLFGSSHGSYKPNKKIFGENFEDEVRTIYKEIAEE